MPDSVGRASILYVLKSWVLLPLGIISSVLTARVLGPEVKGLFALFLTTQGILVLPGAAIGAALVHFVASQRPDVTRLKKLITLLTVFQAALSASLLGLLLLIPKVKTVLFGGLGQTYVLAVFLILCANLWITYR